MVKIDLCSAPGGDIVATTTKKKTTTAPNKATTQKKTTATPKKATTQKKTTATPKKTTTTKKPAATKKTTSPPKKKAPPTQLEAPEWKPIKKKRKRKQQPPKAWHEKSIAEKVAYRRQNQGTILATVTMAALVLAAGFFKHCLMGYSFSALVCLCLAGLIGFYTYFPKLFRKFPGFTRTVTRMFTIILCIGLTIFALTEAVIIHASFGSQDTDFDYLLVLGAKVRETGPSLSLTNRIDKAYEYLKAYPDTVAILSGGQGPDEPVTEAACMYDRLVTKGIDPDRLWKEDKATSTWENLKFALDLVEQRTGKRPTKLGVVSSEYHLFRASLFAGEHGVEFVGVPAETTKISLKVNYFLREVAGVWHYILLGGRYE